MEESEALLGALIQFIIIVAVLCWHVGLHRPRLFIASLRHAYRRHPAPRLTLIRS